MEYIDYDSFLCYDCIRRDELRPVFNELKELALEFKIKIIINQKEYIMEREIRG